MNKLVLVQKKSIRHPGAQPVKTVRVMKYFSNTMDFLAEVLIKSPGISIFPLHVKSQSLSVLFLPIFF